MTDTNFTPHEPSYTVDEFCTVERIGRVNFWKHGKGPRFYWNGRSRRITHRARLEWQATMEAEATKEAADASAA